MDPKAFRLGYAAQLGEAAVDGRPATATDLGPPEADAGDDLPALVRKARRAGSGTTVRRAFIDKTADGFTGARNTPRSQGRAAREVTRSTAGDMPVGLKMPL